MLNTKDFATHVNLTPADTHRWACNQCSERCRSRHRKFHMKPNGHRRKWMKETSGHGSARVNTGNVSPIKKGRSFFRHSWRTNGETKHRETQRSSEGPKGEVPRGLKPKLFNMTTLTPLPSPTGAGKMTPAASEECREERVEVTPATRRWYCHFESEFRGGRNHWAIPPRQSLQ